MDTEFEAWQRRQIAERADRKARVKEAGTRTTSSGITQPPIGTGATGAYREPVARASMPSTTPPAIQETGVSEPKKRIEVNGPSPTMAGAGLGTTATEEMHGPPVRPSFLQRTINRFIKGDFTER